MDSRRLFDAIDRISLDLARLNSSALGLRNELGKPIKVPPIEDTRDDEIASLRELVKELREGLEAASDRLRAWALSAHADDELEDETLVKTLPAIDALIAKADKATGDE